MLSVRYFRPSAAVRGLVASYYLLSIDAQDGEVVRDVLLPEGPKLRFHVTGRFRAQTHDRPWRGLPQAFIGGALTWPTPIEAQGRVQLFGAELTPAGWQALVRAPASALLDDFVGLEEVAGEAGIRLAAAVASAGSDAQRVRLVDRFMARATTEPLPDIVYRLANVLDGAPPATVADWAAQIDLSERQLERLSTQYLGMTPKLVLRHLRFQQTMVAYRRHGPDGWQPAVLGMYADQSHFIREFKRFTGVTPRQFLDSERAITDMAFRARDTFLGAPQEAFPGGIEAHWLNLQQRRDLTRDLTMRPIDRAADGADGGGGDDTAPVRGQDQDETRAA